MDVLHQRLHLLLEDKIPYDHLPFGCYPYSMFIQDHRHTNIPMLLYKWISHSLNMLTLYIPQIRYHTSLFAWTIWFAVRNIFSAVAPEYTYHSNFPYLFPKWIYYAYNHSETQPFELLACLIAWIDYLSIAEECISSSFTYLTICYHRQADKLR